MNVLQVLVDSSPPAKSDLRAPTTSPSAGGFARVFDTALSGASSWRSAPAPIHADQPPPPREPTPQSASAESRRQDRTSPAGTVRPDSATPRRHASEPSRSEAARNGGHRAAEAKPREKQKSTGSDAGPSHPAQSAKKQTEAGHEPGGARAKAATQPATGKGKEKEAGAGAKTGLFPGVVMLGTAPKELQTALMRAVEKAAVETKAQDKAAGALETAGAKSPKGPPTAKLGTKGKKAAALHEKKMVVSVDLRSGQLAVQSASPLTVAETAAAQHSGLVDAGARQSTQTHPETVAQPSVQGQSAGSPAALTVVDLRQNDGNNKPNTGSQNGQQESHQAVNVRLFQIAGGGAAGSSSINGEAPMARAAGPPPPSGSFSALSEQIVRQTGILLKSNNAGEIRLVLKPEQLGNMRIKIEMVNNNLSGKIFVQNHEALRLVQQNLDGLYRALRDSGFNATQLNVSVGGKESHERNREHSSPLPSARALQGIAGLDRGVPGMEPFGGLHSLVNLVI